MSEVLKYLFKSFVLIRDIFGYLIPGAFFAALLFPAESWEFINTAPGWFTLAALTLCLYVAGVILVTIGLILFKIPKLAARVFGATGGSKDQYPDSDIVLLVKRSAPAGRAHSDPQDAEMQIKQQYADEFYYRATYPDIFVEPDRQQIVRLMELGVGVALVLSGIWHAIQGEMEWSLSSSPWVVFLALGLAMLAFTYRRWHIVELFKAAGIMAARTAAEKAGHDKTTKDGAAAPRHKLDIAIEES
jgi:hypothetical protein